MQFGGAAFPVRYEEQGVSQEDVLQRQTRCFGADTASLSYTRREVCRCGTQRAGCSPQRVNVCARQVAVHIRPAPCLP